MSESFEIPREFGPEQCSPEKKQAMYAKILEFVAQWRAEDQQREALAENPFTQKESMAICKTCCLFYSEIPHANPLICDECGSQDSIDFCEEEFFVNHFKQITDKNPAIMRSAFDSTL